MHCYDRRTVSSRIIFSAPTLHGQPLLLSCAHSSALMACTQPADALDSDYAGSNVLEQKDKERATPVSVAAANETAALLKEVLQPLGVAVPAEPSERAGRRSGHASSGLRSPGELGAGGDRVDGQVGDGGDGGIVDDGRSSCSWLERRREYKRQQDEQRQRQEQEQDLQ